MKPQFKHIFVYCDVLDSKLGKYELILSTVAYWLGLAHMT